ncbi:hypothetical protein Dsin_005937 [Dipteronia sinensis]|uniref:Anaphase-promoting complex subunit 4-like WD40 domain-containing protein n=1 Tax=Dipteronia sinensis TaxID=43782 RepID=A0AAE0EGY7_9ROSI|nr:hypothetical protein Dsin_005937 [Dipteronia sinensis]
MYCAEVDVSNVDASNMEILRILERLVGVIDNVKAMSAMDFDYMDYMLTDDGRNGKENEAEDNFYLNLLDWGCSNVLAIALGNTMYLCDGSHMFESLDLELVTVDDEEGHVTSVSWAPDGQLIVVGLNNSHVQIWDSTATQMLRTLRCDHISRIDGLAGTKTYLPPEECMVK